jgi:hypothetical protein
MSAALAAPLLAQDLAAYMNPDLSFDKRAEDLFSRMTIEEQLSQPMNDSSIPAAATTSDQRSRK